MAPHVRGRHVMLTQPFSTQENSARAILSLYKPMWEDERSSGLKLKQTPWFQGMKMACHSCPSGIARELEEKRDVFNLLVLFQEPLRVALNPPQVPPCGDVLGVGDVIVEAILGIVELELRET
jgi:hypothetical protein